MHIRNKKSSNGGICENIEIDGWKEETVKDSSKLKKVDIHIGKIPIKTVKEHLYLGDILEDSGSNRLNVLSRANKGQSVINDICHILEGTYFGSSYFEAMKLMRESMLLSVITNNLEVSFNLTTRDIKTLNNIDIQLLQQCLCHGGKSS